MFDDGVSCCLGILCTDFYLLVKIFGREGLLYGFIVVTLLENNMALVGPINYYYKERERIIVSLGWLGYSWL